MCTLSAQRYANVNKSGGLWLQDYDKKAVAQRPDLRTKREIFITLKASNLEFKFVAKHPL